MREHFDTPALLYRARDAAEAAVLAHALEHANVRTRRAGGAAAIMFGELGAEALQVDIWVEKRDLVTGRKVIEELQAATAAPMPPKGENWTCASCGEECESSFDACWSCGVGRSVTGS